MMSLFTKEFGKESRKNPIAEILKSNVVYLFLGCQALTEILFVAFSNSLAPVGNKICASKCHGTAKRTFKLTGRFCLIRIFE